MIFCNPFWKPLRIYIPQFYIWFNKKNLPNESSQTHNGNFRTNKFCDIVLFCILLLIQEMVSSFAIGTLTYHNCNSNFGLFLRKRFLLFKRLSILKYFVYNEWSERNSSSLDSCNYRSPLPSANVNKQEEFAEVETSWKVLFEQGG